MADGLVKLDISEFLVRIRALKRPHAPVVRALNRSVASGRTALVRGIASDTGLKASDVREFVQVREATESTLAATIYASANRVPLIKFGAKGPVPSRGLPPGVRARLKGGAGTYPHAFIASVGKGGHVGVFQRIGKARLPIAQLHGPSIWKASDKFVDTAAARAHEQLAKNLPREIEFEFSR